MKLDFENDKVDRSRAESENPLDYSLHEDIDNIIMERYPSEPLPFAERSLTNETEVNIIAMRRKQIKILELE